jgi:hypothetical protein
MEIESLNLRLGVLFGSTQEGAKAFQVMEKFASKVPFSLEEIQQGAGVLASVTKNADELKEMLEITGNVAAVSGLDFKTTAEQMQRSWSAGIGAADLFRDKAVRSMLGFKAGTQVSIEDTIKHFRENFGKGGRLGDITDLLADTMAGTMSMIGDKFFQFKKHIGMGFFEPLKAQLKDFDAFLAQQEALIAAVGVSIGRGLAKAFKAIEIILKELKEHSKEIVLAMTALISLGISSFILKVTAALYQLIKATSIAGAVAALMTLNWKKFLAVLGGGFVVFKSLNKVMDQYIKDLEKAVKKIKEMDKETSKTTSNNKKDLTLLGESWESFTSGMTDAFDKHKMTLQQGIKSIGQAFVDHIFGAIKQLSDAFVDAILDAESFKASMIEIFKNLGREILKSIVRIAAIIIASKIIVILQIMIEKVKELGREMQRTANIAAGIFAGFMVGGPIGASIGGFIGGLKDGGIVKGGLEVPSFASGGITNAPTLAMIGDNSNNREAVVPLPDGRSIPVDMQGGVQSIGQLNILPNANIDEALMEKPMSFWVDLVQAKILPALNNLGKDGETTSLAFKESR